MCLGLKKSGVRICLAEHKLLTFTEISKFGCSSTRSVGGCLYWYLRSNTSLKISDVIGFFCFFNCFQPFFNHLLTNLTSADKIKISFSNNSKTRPIYVSNFEKRIEKTTENQWRHKKIQETCAEPQYRQPPIYRSW